jgi:hypothetical protein
LDGCWFVSSPTQVKKARKGDPARYERGACGEQHPLCLFGNVIRNHGWWRHPRGLNGNLKSGVLSRFDTIRRCFMRLEMLQTIMAAKMHSLLEP